MDGGIGKRCSFKIMSHRRLRHFQGNFKRRLGTVLEAALDVAASPLRGSMKMPQLNPADVASPITRQLLLLLLLFGCCFSSSVTTGTKKLHPGSLRAKELVTYTVEQLGSVTSKLSDVAGHFNPSAGGELSAISDRLFTISGLLNSTDPFDENITLGAALPSNIMVKQLKGTIDELQSLVWYARQCIGVAAVAGSRHVEASICPGTSTESSATSSSAKAVIGSSPKERPGGSAGDKPSSDGRPYFVNQPLPMQTVVALDAPPGTAVYTLQASDPDPYDDLHFLLVRDRTGGRFEVDERSGVVLTRGSDPFALDLEYVLYVRVEDHANLDEDGKFQKSEEQRLSIVGGKREPQFFQSSYGTNITENHTLDAEVLTVNAKSFNGNDVRYALKSYGLDSVPFSIDSITGVVRLTKPLDYEDRSQPNVYQLEVLAIEGSREVAAKVQMEIHVTDVNDNSPKFDLPYYQVSGVAEGTAIGSELARVSATDADSGVNSGLSYSLPEGGTSSLFDVDEQGVIYNRQTLDASKRRGVHEFLVRATDGGNPPKHDTATVRLYVRNTRNDPPRFSQQVYTPHVAEDVRENTLVTTVWAFDPDGDMVTYALSTADMPFVLDDETGEVRVRRGTALLDRDKYEMNVTATDDGSCCADGSRSSHTSTAVVVVFVVDVNDNKPEFPECDSYRPTVVPGLALRNSSAESRRFLLRVEATDRDRGSNGQIHYSLGDAGSEFDIDSGTGDVFVTNEISTDGAGERLVSLSVWATDGGSPQFQTVCNVIVRIAGRSDSQPVFGREEYVAVISRNTAVGSRLLQVSAQSSSEDRVQFGLMAPDDAGTDASPLFSIDPHSGLIVLQKPLGGEVEYRLRVSATNTRSVPPLTSYANVRFLLRDSSSTKASDTRVKDQAPVFSRNHFEAEVDENAELGRSVITVAATDPDGLVWLHYRLVEGDSGQHFDIGNNTGVIYVNTALDYEAQQEHELRVVASDGTHETHADVLIRVRDVNEHPPRFNRSIYRTQVMEEDDEELPKRILQVAATDGDTGSSVGLVYFLAGQGVDTGRPDRSTFTINQTSGEIFVTKRLDRDRPNGQSRWWLTVLAKDEGGSGLVGHANLQVDVEDINDNPPVFSRAYFLGSVAENRTDTEGVFTAKVVAEDHDDPNKPSNSKLAYSIRRNAVMDGRPIFSIESETGIIRTNVCCLDREVTADYSLEVMATDPGGLRGTATAVIRVKDVNDSPPRFGQDKYNIVMDETHGGHLPKDAVLNVTVLDDDVNNTFFYSVLEDSGLGADKFIIVPGDDNTASLRIVRPLDYEDKTNQNGFSFVIQVDDDGGSGRAAQAQVNVQLRDVNDNRPSFARSSIKVSVAENMPVGYQIANFSASDADGNGDGKVFYAIDEDSDRNQKFSIDEQGTVVLQRTLDRERETSHHISVLAIDDGAPPNTATATLTVIVEDINDNPPTFLKEYSAVLLEHSVPRKVAEVWAADADDLGNGAPFSFRLAANADDEVRRSFRVEHVPRGANGDGMALVLSLRTFDRAQRDEYHVPIVIKDSGGPALSATSTLTVYIGSRDD